jgi:hypothetical protein
MPNSTSFEVRVIIFVSKQFCLSLPLVSTVNIRFLIETNDNGAQQKSLIMKLIENVKKNLNTSNSFSVQNIKTASRGCTLPQHVYPS